MHRRWRTTLKPSVRRDMDIICYINANSLSGKYSILAAHAKGIWLAFTAPYALRYKF